MPVYLEYKALWWVKCGDAEGCEALPALADGLCTYAGGQAKLL